MSDICKNCKHFQDNVTPEKIEIEDFCVGSLGSDGYYTWGTPMWKNMDKNIWNAVSNQMAFSSPEREPDCFAFSRHKDRPCTCGSRDATITPSPDLASCWNCGNSLHYMEGVGGYCPDCGAS